jgi:adenylate cyclase
MSLFAELKRRNVFRVAAAYLIVGWLAVQVLDLAAESFEAPAWVMKMIIALLVVGFVPALLFSWAYELTPEGLKKDSEVDRSDAGASQTANKLNVVTILAVVGIAALIGWQQLNPPASTPVADAPALEAQESTPSFQPVTDEPISDASIAVLPFADLSPEGDHGYFSDGVSEEILNVLVRIKGLRVASRTSAFAYKNSLQRIPEIARELGVRHILEGSVRRAGENIRVTAQLIDAETDEHLLSETFDRTLTAENVFAIQGDIAQLIVTALSERIEISDIGAPVAVTADTEDLATLDLYYEANSLFLLRGRENLTRAMQLFEQMTASDPDFARGWAGLANVYAVGQGWQLEPRDYYRLTYAAAERAIALNPKLSSPYAALGEVEQMQSTPDFALALKNFGIAEQLNPDDPNLYNWRSLLWVGTGFIERAFEDHETCLRLDPSYINCEFNKLALLLATGRKAEADELHLSLLLKGLTTQTELPALIKGLVEQQDHERLLISLNFMVAERFPGQRWMIKELYNGFTDPAFDHAARRELFFQRLESSTGSATIRSGVTRAVIALAFRDYDLALQDRGIPLAWYGYFDEISDAQKRRAIIDAGIPEFWRTHGFPPQCRPVGEDDFECD